MSNSEAEPDQARQLEDIILRMKLGEEVSLQDQLLFLYACDALLSQYLADGGSEAFIELENVRSQIYAINEKIMNSGPLGSMTGESTRRDAHNTPH